MARVKRAVNAHKKRRTILETASGYRGQRGPHGLRPFGQEAAGPVTVAAALQPPGRDHSGRTR